MCCEFTEEVSLLVDGELAPHEAARLRAHLETCTACRQAREAFLLLRQELRSYERAPDPHAQSRALAAILGSPHPTTPRKPVWRLAGSLAAAFSVQRLRHAHVATLALLLIGTVLGVRWFMGSRKSSFASQPGAPAVANVNSLPVPAPNVAEGVGNRQEKSDPVTSPTIRHEKTPKAPRSAGIARLPRENARVRRDAYPAGLQALEGLSRGVQQEPARVVEPASLPSSASAVMLYAAGGLRAAADPSLRIGRHAERVERLLRSFRNARLTESDPTLGVADARRLSKRLLYNNIALRREAASAGDLPVEGLLESVEPILIDISNLPNAPSPDAVGSIKERIHRRQLVGVLQAQAMPASRY